MIRLPDRISALIAKVESGVELTPDDVRRTSLLQALDVAKLGEDFVRDVIAADEAMTKSLAERGP